jgi:hypothetical protein
MTHPRKVIRAAARDAILGGNTAAGDRVWAGQEPPVDVKALLIDEGAVVLVYTRHDRLEGEYPPTGSGYVRRKCDLMIECLAAGNHGVEDKLDDLAEEIEPILNGLAVPGQPATEIRHMETNVEASDIGEQTVGGAFLLFEACYWALWRQDPDEQPDFLPCGNEFDVGVKVNGGQREPWPMCESH